jgi:hypothetical protein
MNRRSFTKQMVATGGIAVIPVVAGCSNSKRNNPVPSVNPLDFGAKADGKTVNTLSMQKTIDFIAGQGGGEVVLTPGVYVTGTVVLKTNITLKVLPGATILGSPDPNDYKLVENYAKGSYEEALNEGLRCLIYAEDAENIMICGGGTIDGNGPAFWEKVEGDRLWISPKPKRVTPMFMFKKCTNVRLENFRIQRSPGWSVHLYLSDQIFVHGIQIKNIIWGPNCDGFDINGCRDVIISDCNIETGDDAFCLKSTKGTRSCERVVITNCIIRTNCAAFRIGGESWFDMRHVNFSNSVVHRSSRAIDIAMMDGAVCEDVNCTNISIDTNCGIPMNRAIHLELRSSHGLFGGDAKVPIGKMRRINISNITLNTDGRILLTAEKGGMLENITLSNIHMALPWIEDPEMVKDKSDKYQSSNFNPEARIAKAAVVAENISNLILQNMTIAWPDGKVPADFLSKKEHHEEIIDPKTSTLPLPAFHAIWANNVSGTIDAPLISSSEKNIEKFHLNNCKLTIR